MQLKSPAYEKSAASADFKAWLIHGADQGRASALSLGLQSRYKRQGLESRVYDAGTIIKDPALLADGLAGASLFSPAAVIRIRDGDDKLAKVLEPVLGDDFGDAKLIIEAGELTAASKLKKAFDQRNDCALMTCWEPNQQELAIRATEALKALGVRHVNGVPQLMASLSPSDSGAILMECRKLATYVGGRQATLDDVTAACADNAEAGFSDVAHAVADGNPAKAAENYHRMMQAGESGIAVMRTVQIHFQRLHAARIAMEAGKNAETAISGLRPPVFWKDKPALTRQVGRWTVRDLEAALTRLVEAERLSKLGYPEIPVIGQAILDVAGKAPTK